MKIWLTVIATFSLLTMGCGARVTVKSNVSAIHQFLYGGTIKVFNSAGENILLIPQSEGDYFVAEYTKGKRDPLFLGWKRKKTPSRRVVMLPGESISLNRERSINDRPVNIPLSVKVVEVKNRADLLAIQQILSDTAIPLALALYRLSSQDQAEFVGTYHDCYKVYQYQDSNFVFDFTNLELENLKRNYNGRPCRGRGESGYHYSSGYYYGR